MTLAELVAAKAQSIVDTLTRTDYQHTDNIQPAAGIYDCDCNGFVHHVLTAVAPAEAALIAFAAGDRPLAHEYFEFFASLTPQSPGAWQRVDLLADVRRGDIMAWRFPTIEPNVDTGHVVIVAEPASIDASGAHVMRVYDSAAAAHFEDTRAPGGTPSPKGPTGVGSGFVNFQVDAEGRPLAYLFSPPITAQFSYRPIAIGRLV